MKSAAFYLRCSRQESNLHRILRKDMSYPLNDGSEVSELSRTD